MKRLIYIIPAIALLVSGCTKRIDLELNTDENVRLVVEGWITNQQQAHLVQLTTTTSYFENQAAPRVSGATVSISDGTTTFPLTENGAGMYYTDPNVAGEIGKTYTLNVVWNNEDFAASAYLDTVPMIDSIAQEWHLEPDWEPEDEHLDLFLYTQELPGLGNHYMWRIFRNGESLRDTLTEITFVEDDFVDGNYIAGWQFDWIDAEPGDTVTVEQLAISEEANAIFIAIMLETDWRGGPFDTPPANVPSNISNGALGYFGAAGVSEYTLIVDP